MNSFLVLKSWLVVSMIRLGVVLPAFSAHCTCQGASESSPAVGTSFKKAKFWQQLWRTALGRKLPGSLVGFYCTSGFPVLFLNYMD